MEDKVKICCICGCKFIGWGNNPDGAVWKTADGEIEIGEFNPEDRCCDACNSHYVIPGRMYLIDKRKNEK